MADIYETFLDNLKLAAHADLEAQALVDWYVRNSVQAHMIIGDQFLPNYGDTESFEKNKEQLTKLLEELEVDAPETWEEYQELREVLADAPLPASVEISVQEPQKIAVCTLPLGWERAGRDFLALVACGRATSFAGAEPQYYMVLRPVPAHGFWQGLDGLQALYVCRRLMSEKRKQPDPREQLARLELSNRGILEPSELRAHHAGWQMIARLLNKRCRGVVKLAIEVFGLTHENWSQEKLQVCTEMVLKLGADSTAAPAGPQEAERRRYLVEKIVMRQVLNDHCLMMESLRALL